MARKYKYKYQIVNTSTIAGLRKAERLKEAGWVIISTSINQIIFEKKQH